MGIVDMVLTLLSDGGIAAVMIALLGAGTGVAALLSAKTRKEAGVDFSHARFEDGQSYDLVIRNLREEVSRLAKSLEDERRECDEKIAKVRREGERQIRLLREQMNRLEERSFDETSPDRRPGER